MMPMKNIKGNLKSFFNFLRRDDSLGFVVGLFSWFLAYSAIRNPVYTHRGTVYNFTGAEYIIAGILIIIGMFLIIDSIRK